MVQTFFTDVPRPLVALVTEPFGAVMKEATGFPGELTPGGDVYAVAKKLSAGDLHLAVFHGFEFAWAQQRHPELKPLMVAVNAQREVRAYVLVRKDSDAATLADLKGKDLSIPKRSREHCRLFVERHTGDGTGCDMKDFYGHVVASANVETGLDELCQGKVQAAVVDTLGLEFYKDLKPGCFARLKVLKQSDPFPAAVIAYRAGTLDDAALTKFRDGLVNAHKSELGREIMKMWKVAAFETVPPDYAQGLADVLRAYPPPDAPAKVSRR
jgi:ABC-type phosphate/phosphonate transport system substrate-binding protein